MVGLGQPEQCPHIVERETQLTRTPDEYEPPHISRPIAPIAPGAIWPFCQPSRHRVDGARCLLIVGIGMECGARYVDRRLSASGLSGQRGTCGKQFNERSVGVLNRAQYPSDVIALVVFWRLRYKLSLRDLAEMFLTRGFIFSYEAVRDWEAKLTPTLAENLRRRRKGRIGPSWYVDETYIRVRGRWRYLYRAIATALWLTSC